MLTLSLQVVCDRLRSFTFHYIASSTKGQAVSAHTNTPLLRDNFVVFRDSCLAPPRRGDLNHSITPLSGTAPQQSDDGRLKGGEPTRARNCFRKVATNNRVPLQNRNVIITDCVHDKALVMSIPHSIHQTRHFSQVWARLLSQSRRQPRGRFRLYKTLPQPLQRHLSDSTGITMSHIRTATVCIINCNKT